jgi:hypothetical protein
VSQHFKATQSSDAAFVYSFLKLSIGIGTNKKGPEQSEPFQRIKLDEDYFFNKILRV